MEYLTLALGYVIGAVMGVAGLRLYQLRKPDTQLPGWVTDIAHSNREVELSRGQLILRLKTTCQLLLTSEKYGKDK